jgi:hypothetical protein
MIIQSTLSFFMSGLPAEGIRQCGMCGDNGEERHKAVVTDPLIALEKGRRVLLECDKRAEHLSIRS